MKKKKILVVDDSLATRGMLAELLESAVVNGSSLEAEIASNGKEALKMIKRGRFDLIISDVNMPEMGGIELTRRIKYDFPGLPVILISSDSFCLKSQEVKHLTKYVLSKPFNFELLLVILAFIFPWE